MKIQRGDVVACVLPGDFGKPRPALVVQADLLNQTHPSILIAPITSTILELETFRLTLKPDEQNGLKQLSQVMVDKTSSIKRERVSKKIGTLTPKQIQAIDKMLHLVLGLV